MILFIPCEKDEQVADIDSAVTSRVGAQHHTCFITLLEAKVNSLTEMPGKQVSSHESRHEGMMTSRLNVFLPSYHSVLVSVDSRTILPHGESTSATFIARLARGASQAEWYQFLARYGEPILSIARRHGLQQADCDDVLQDSMIEVTRSMKGFDSSRGRFRNYLRQIVLRVTYRKVRQKYAESGQQPLDEHRIVGTRRLLACEHGEDVWEDEWRRYHVRQALRTIESEFSELNRTAFMMCTAHGQSPQHVAELLGISVDQVYQAKSRILRRLHAVIELQVAEEG